MAASAAAAALDEAAESMDSIGQWRGGGIGGCGYDSWLYFQRVA